MRKTRRTDSFSDDRDDMPAGHVAYDPDIIQHAAQKLYAAAHNVIASHAFIGGIVGLAAGGMIADGMFGLILQLACMIALAGLGAYLGHEKALDYKLRAQTALCQIRIEENTRKPAAEGHSITARPAFAIGTPSNEDDSEDDNDPEAEETTADDDPLALRAYK